MKSRGTQPYIHMDPFSPKLPSHPGCPIHWAEFPGLYHPYFLNKLPDPSDDQIGTLGLVGGNKSLMFLHLFFHIWSVFISLLSLDSSFLRISRFWESLQFLNEDTKSRKFTWLVKSESGSEARIPIYKLSMVSFSLAPSCEWRPGLALLGKEQQTRLLFSR